MIYTSEYSSCYIAVFENTYFTFLSDFKKHGFLRFFWNDVSKSRKKSRKYQVCWMSIEILASKLSHVYHIFLCPHFWARSLTLVTVTYRYWLPVI